MKDEEVGELWRWLNSPAPIDLPLHKECRDLIIKLVEERKHRNQAEAWMRWIINGKQGPSPSMILPDDAEVARDFGIDPATWPKE